MTICFALLCEDGKNCVMASDSYAVNTFGNLIITKSVSKIYRTNTSLIAVSGSTLDIDLIMEAYSNPFFLFPSEYYGDVPKSGVIEQVYRTLKINENENGDDKYYYFEPDIRLWFSYYRHIRDRRNRLNFIRERIDTDDVGEIHFIIAFIKDGKVQLSRIYGDSDFYRDTLSPFVAIGIYESFEVMIRKDPWDSNSSVEEAQKRANEILDFYNESVSLVGGVKHIQVLVK